MQFCPPRFYTLVSKVLVWHHCHHVFASFWTFLRVHTFSIVTTNAFCRLCQARAAFTAADGKVAKSARCSPLVPSRCFAMWFMVSRKILSPSLSLLCWCLAHAFVCAILFNKDTFYSNIDVKSIYIHDTRRDLPYQVMGGEQGWVMQGVLSRASFRRPPTSGQVTFIVLQLHINNIYAEKKGITKKLIIIIRAIMISQQIDLVAGDFNGTAWRCRSRNNISTIDEAFTLTAPSNATAPTPLWGRVSIPNNWADVCGFF